MTEKLGEIGDALSNIHKAVKTAKSLQQKNSELFKVIEQTKKQAENVAELQIPDEPLLLELKRVVGKVRDTGSKLEVWLKNFTEETVRFERFVRASIQGQAIPPEVMKEFCAALERMHGMASGFSDAFEKFVKTLDEAQGIAVKLTDKLKKKEQEQQEQANSARNKGAAGSVGLALAGAVALGFFTGGVAWVAAGAVAGAACGVAAAAVAVKTVVDVKEMRKLAGEIQKNANQLESIAKSLKASSDMAGGIKLDSEAIESLRTALEFFRIDQAKDERIAQLQAKDQEKDQMIEEMKRKMAEMESKIQSRNN